MSSRKRSPPPPRAAALHREDVLLDAIDEPQCSPCLSVIFLSTAAGQVVSGPLMPFPSPGTPARRFSAKPFLLRDTYETPPTMSPRRDAPLPDRSPSNSFPVPPPSEPEFAQNNLVGCQLADPRACHFVEHFQQSTGSTTRLRGSHRSAPKFPFALRNPVGVLKSGAAYTCLDPSMPSQRASYLLHDSGSGVRPDAYDLRQ